jgi:hypothetical protein
MNVLIKQRPNSITSKDMVNYTNISTLATTIFTKFISAEQFIGIIIIYFLV